MQNNDTVQNPVEVHTFVIVMIHIDSRRINNKKMLVKKVKSRKKFQ